MQLLAKIFNLFTSLIRGDESQRYFLVGLLTGLLVISVPTWNGLRCFLTAISVSPSINLFLSVSGLFGIYLVSALAGILVIKKAWLKKIHVTVGGGLMVLLMTILVHATQDPASCGCSFKEAHDLTLREQQAVLTSKDDLPAALEELEQIYTANGKVEDVMNGRQPLARDFYKIEFNEKIYCSIVQIFDPTLKVSPGMDSQLVLETRSTGGWKKLRSSNGDCPEHFEDARGEWHFEVEGDQCRISLMRFNFPVIGKSK